MQTEFSMDLVFFTSGETCSLDERMLRFKNLFENHACCSILHAFLDFFQGSLISKAATGRLAGHEGQWYAKDGTYKKMLRTSLGEFEYVETIARIPLGPLVLSHVPVRRPCGTT